MRKERRFKNRQEYLQSLRKSNWHFLNGVISSGRYVKVMYARDTAQIAGYDKSGQPIMGRGNPVGVFLAYEDDERKLRVGWSSYNRGREVVGTLIRPDGKVEELTRAVEPYPFDSAYGTYLALRRAAEEESIDVVAANYRVDFDPDRMDLVPTQLYIQYINFVNEVMRELEERGEYQKRKKELTIAG